MPFDLQAIEQAAARIRQQIDSGEIVTACCMSAHASPVTEAWDAAGALAENATLSAHQQQALLQSLGPAIRQQLEATGFDTFDLIYEGILQRIADDS